jgi:hypothetical protein
MRNTRARVQTKSVLNGHDKGQALCLCCCLLLCVVVCCSVPWEGSAQSGLGGLAAGRLAFACKSYCAVATRNLNIVLVDDLGRQLRGGRQSGYSTQISTQGGEQGMLPLAQRAARYERSTFASHIRQKGLVIVAVHSVVFPILKLSPAGARQARRAPTPVDFPHQVRPGCNPGSLPPVRPTCSAAPANREEGISRAAASFPRPLPRFQVRLQLHFAVGRLCKAWKLDCTAPWMHSSI